MIGFPMNQSNHSMLNLFTKYSTKAPINITKSITYPF